MLVRFATTWDSPCGVADYSHELVGELAKTLDVQVVSLDPGAISTSRELAAKLYLADLAHVQFQYPFFGGMRVHRNWFTRLLRDVHIPLVVTLHELDLGERDIFLISAYKRWLNRSLFGRREIDRLVVHSSEYKRSLVNLGVESGDIRVIPMWVPRVVPPRISPEQAKSELGLGGKKVVTIFGFVVKRKGYDLALDSVRHWPENTVLLIAGGPHAGDYTGYFSYLKRRIEEEGLSELVKVTGYLPEERVPIIMAATDVIAAPFLEMSSSWSMMYAIAYGKPIIASDLPQNRELAAQAYCLVLFKTGDHREFANVLSEVVRDESRLEALSAAAREYAASRTVAHAASDTISVYRELVAF
ncbi:MAG: glycosyltransferase [Armatimonadetes bacterium]|nr:glycosyltransferase [Armatimonadota bacterium]